MCRIVSKMDTIVSKNNNKVIQMSTFRRYSYYSVGVCIDLSEMTDNAAYMTFC